MREHIKLLGILNIVMGGLTALIGIGALLVMGSLAGIITASLSSASGGDFDNGRFAAPLVAFIGFAFGIFFLLLSAPSIIGGWGLLTFKPWSRILMMVVSGFHLLHVPLGTVLGVYGLWVLLNEQTRQLLDSHGAFPPAPLPYMPPPGSFPAAYPPAQPPAGV